MIVTLPWPPRILSPNARAHWATKAKAVASYKSSCWFLCLEAKARKLQPGTFRVVVTFCPPDRRWRDDDNMIGAFKAGRDAVAKAIGVDDAKWRPEYRFAEPVNGGAVVVEVAPE